MAPVGYRWEILEEEAIKRETETRLKLVMMIDSIEIK